MNYFYAALKTWVELKRNDPEYSYEVHSFDINDNCYYSPEKEEPESWFWCGICGKPEQGSLSRPNDRKKTRHEELKEKHLCHSCDHWKSQDLSAESCIIVNSSVYSNGGRKSPDERFLGHSGREFLILNHKTNKLISTNNLWSGGTIPKRFMVPDNSEFVTERSPQEDIDFIKVMYPEMDEQCKKSIERIEKEKERAKQREINKSKGLDSGFPF